MPRLVSDKYEVLEKIGEGGMGAVYKARHTFLDTIVALKLLPTRLAEHADLVVRFQREARVMAQLRHENIVRVFDIERDDDVYYLVQEFVDGQNLAEYLRDHAPLPIASALDIGCQVARALAYAHARQVIHRDVKPSNVLVDRSDPPKASLTDFGIAKVDDAGDQTRTGAVLGSVKYSAPEQLGYKIGGKGVPVDARADVYSLGLLLYEVIEGRSFFDGLDAAEVIGRLLYDPGPLDPTFSRPVPDRLVATIRRAMSRNPADRHPGVRDMLDELESVLDTVAVPLRLSMVEAISPADDEATIVMAAAHGERPEVDDAPIEVPTEWGRRGARPRSRRALAPAVGLLVLAAAAGALWRADGPRRAITDRVGHWLATPAHLGWKTEVPEGRDVAARVGERVAFAVSPDTGETDVASKVVWLVDGREVGDGREFGFTPTADDEGRRFDVTAIATVGDAALRRSWNVSVEWYTPLIERSDPPESEVAIAAGASRRFAVTVSARRRGAQAFTYSWLRNGKEVQHGGDGEWTLDDATENDRMVAVAVRDDAGLTVADRAWRLSVAAAAPPVTLLARHPSGDEPVEIAAGRPVEFSVDLSKPDADATYAWKLDGTTVGSAAGWRWSPGAETVAGRHSVEVEVRADGAAGPLTAAWTVEVESPSPTLLASTPRGRTMQASSTRGLEFTADVSPGATQEWKVDGSVVLRRNRRLTLGHALAPGRHSIEVAAVDPGGRRSDPIRWTLDLAAPEPPREPKPSPPATAPVVASPEPTRPVEPRVSRAEAESWIDQVRNAWEGQDAATLRSLGLRFSQDLLMSNSMIGNASILIDSRGARVKLEQVELDDMNQVVSVRPGEFRLRHGADGVVAEP